MERTNPVFKADFAGIFLIMSQRVNNSGYNKREEV